MINRRGFFAGLSGLLATSGIDVERLLWTPKTKTIFIPKPIVIPSAITGITLEQIKEGQRGFVVIAEVPGVQQFLESIAGQSWFRNLDGDAVLSVIANSTIAAHSEVQLIRDPKDG